MQSGYGPFFFLTNSSACQYFDIGTELMILLKFILHFFLLTNCYAWQYLILVQSWWFFSNAYSISSCLSIALLAIFDIGTDLMILLKVYLIFSFLPIALLGNILISVQIWWFCSKAYSISFCLPIALLAIFDIGTDLMILLKAYSIFSFLPIALLGHILISVQIWWAVAP